MYGDVVRVKILFNKKDTALIQFNDGQQAQTGTSYIIVLVLSELYKIYQTNDSDILLDLDAQCNSMK